MNVFFFEDSIFCKVLYNLGTNFFDQIHNFGLYLFFAFIEILINVWFEQSQEHNFQLLPAGIERVITFDK